LPSARWERTISAFSLFRKRKKSFATCFALLSSMLSIWFERELWTRRNKFLASQEISWCQWTDFEFLTPSFIERQCYLVCSQRVVQEIALKLHSVTVTVPRTRVNNEM
jgi:hypothetical protein